MPKYTPPLPLFRSPADQAARDLAGQSAALRAFALMWHTHITGAMPYGAVRPEAGAAAVPIKWSALPARRGAESGQDGHADLGDRNDPKHHDTPAMAAADRRENQDEYCQWHVLRHPGTGKIVRIDFTCESPDYWQMLWQVSPETVLHLYRVTLGRPDIQSEDLWLRDQGGRPVLDARTGSPHYDPDNRWNSDGEAEGGGGAGRTGGAMHLSGPSNMLQSTIAMLGDVGRARPVRQEADPAAWILRPETAHTERNSDLHIGLLGQLIVGQGHHLGLTDPPGYYLQPPDFGTWRLPVAAPSGARVADYWRINRGARLVNDHHDQALPGQCILHASLEVPPSHGFTVSDILINGEPIRYGAQVAATLAVQVNVTPQRAAEATDSSRPAANWSSARWWPRGLLARTG